MWWLSYYAMRVSHFSSVYIFSLGCLFQFHSLDCQLSGNDLQIVISCPNLSLGYRLYLKDNGYLYLVVPETYELSIWKVELIDFHTNWIFLIFLWFVNIKLGLYLRLFLLLHPQHLIYSSNLSFLKSPKHLLSVSIAKVQLHINFYNGLFANLSSLF